MSELATPASVSRRELLLVASVFVALTCAVTYPQVLHMSSHVGEHYDALFGTWRIAWIAHQLLADPRHLFDANIFYPERNTLAYSDAALLLGLGAAPFIWAGIEAVIVYNGLVLASFVASGTAMYLLAYRLTRLRAAAWIAGAMFAFQPYRFAHFPQIELLWTCWIPIALLALHDLFDTRRIKSGLTLGLAVSLQAWCSLYYVVYLVTGLGVLLLVRFITAPRDALPLLKPLAAAGAIVLLMCGPYAVPYVAAREAIGVRTQQDVVDWSPTLQNYLATARTSVFYNQEAARAGHIEGVLFPGFVATALAIVGAAAARRVVVAYTALVIVAVDVSLGVNGLLYPLLRTVLVPYEGLRVPGRMFVMVSAGLSVLAAFGTARLWQSTRGTKQLVMAAGLATAIVVEGLSIPLTLEPVPNDRGLIYQYLADQERTTILEWPLPRPDRLGITQEPHRMYASLRHWQRLANGYSGYHPSSYVTLLNRMHGFPDAASFQSLRGRRVRYLVLHSGTDPVAYFELLGKLHAHPDVEVMQSERVAGEEMTLVRIRGV